MKPIILSHDGSLTVYMVPDFVADNLKKYCMEFGSDWLQNSPDAAKYYVEANGVFGLCYDGDAFIDYLNTCVFPGQPSYSIYPPKGAEPLWNKSDLPAKYRRAPEFSF